ncbi:hypothetical protein [Dictyobacter formicarum]|nr:hypothetical protein [Dictyobacter formicarum]
MDNSGIITTLLGGMLAIVGGFCATLFAQYMSEIIERKKIKRNKAQELYVMITETENNFISSLYVMHAYIDKGMNLEKAIEVGVNGTNNIYSSANKISSISNIYIEELSEEAETYADMVKKSYIGVLDKILKKESVENIYLEMTDAFTSITLPGKELKLSVKKIINNKQGG